jgi:CHAD domain-containing protein
MASNANPNTDEARHAELVHEARKTIKRMRALARLLRYELGDEELKRVNASLRAAGQRLAGSRDAEVRLATLDRLKARHPEALAGAGVERLRERLAREREEASEPGREREVLGDLGEMRREAARWKLVDHDFQAVAPGLRRIYREGRRRYRMLARQKTSGVEATHDWRKRVKGLYYALDMLGGAQTKGTRGATRRAERLGDVLGEEHDLWLLATYVEQHPETFENDPSTRRALLELADRRRNRLRKRALTQGGRLYRRKPGAFTRRAGSSLAG